MKMARSYTYYTVSLLVIALLLLGSCNENEEVNPKINEDETLVTFILAKIPMALVRSEEEGSTIKWLDVLVFEKEKDGNYTYVFHKSASVTGSNTFEVKLNATENKIKLYFIANMSSFATVSIGDSEDEVIKSLLIEFTGEKLEELPMAGEHELENLPGGSIIENLEVTLLRSVAGVQVKLKDDNALTAKFKLASLQAYRANPLIQVIPAADAYGPVEGEMIVIKPTVPTNMENKSVTTKAILAENGGAGELSGLYIPEAVGYTTPNEQQQKATCLIIGGYYENELSYYRVNFESENSPVGQILRNHQYSIIINSVTGPGTTHPEEAVSSNIKYSINDWTPSDHEIEL